MTRAEHDTAQREILARMAATRAELVAANHVTLLVGRPRRQVVPTDIPQGPVFLQTPYAGLIAAGLIVGTVLGPGQLVRTAARRGLVPWILGTVQGLLSR
ncbi:hypothetical protein AWB64_06196 [Caballeronia sordidicola]|uniref:Uncharacterized protein n=1 Tax=Caballeronia sordidicola TaxID=196367 RepID=A0A158IHH4_CABSO|nr:hypothetical protein AWB64_06196 [Caballeronia sordidicola]